MRPSFALLFGSVLASACVTSKGDYKSTWNALDEAESIDCEAIPLRREDLRINEVHLIPDLGPTLLLDVSSRKGIRSFYHLPFTKLSNLKEENLVPLPIRSDSQFLGAGYFDKQAAFAVKTRERNLPVLQVRDILNNGMIAEYSIKEEGELDLGPWAASSGSLRALVRQSKDEEALDDQPYLQYEIPLKNKGLPKVSPSQSVIGQTALIHDSQGGQHVLWLDRGVSDKTKEPRFRIARWNADKKESPNEIDEKGPVESWGFEQSGDRLAIAFIKGDSLLWENASIEVMQLADTPPFSKRHQASLPLSRVHVAQPLVSSGPKGQFLFLPQWLDHELTVGIYRIDGGDIQPVRYSGVFKEGTAFYKAFFHEPSEKFYLLARSTEGGNLPQFNLCAIDL